MVALVAALGEVGLMAEPEVRVPHDLDRVLAADAVRGDREAAQRLARRVLPTVRRVARALLSNRTDAEDATQMALLEVLRAAGSYRGVGPLEAWSRRIASRAVIRYARRVRANRPDFAPQDEASEPGYGSLRTTI